MAEPLKKTTTNRKQKKFVKALAQTGNVKKSASLAGYDPDYGSFLKRQPHIQTALQKAIDDAGLDDVKVTDKIDEGLKATYVKKDEGKKYPDFHARHKYLDTLLKIRGDYAPEKHEIRQEKLTLIITPDVLKGLKDSKSIEKDEVIEAEIVEEDGRASN